MLIGLAAGSILYVPLALKPSAVTTTVVHHSIQYSFVPSVTLPGVPLFVWQAIYLAIIATALLTIRRAVLRDELRCRGNRTGEVDAPPDIKPISAGRPARRCARSSYPWMATLANCWAMFWKFTVLLRPAG